MLIEQRLLPHDFQISCGHVSPDFAEAGLSWRRFAADGATAAYGLAQGVRAFRGKDLIDFHRTSASYRIDKSVAPLPWTHG